MTGLFLGVLAVATGYVLIGTLLDSFLFPEEEPGPPYYPPPGYRFISRTEGFEQTVLKRENGLLWLELRLAPYAAGPPEHVHTTFSETFMVAEGTLAVLLDGQTRCLGAGEALRVPPGTPHRLFNATGTPVVVRGPVEEVEYAVPERFGVFLTQAYGVFDRAPAGSRPLRALLQMSRFSPRYDVWLAGPPVALQKAVFVALRPMARLLGYRTHYEEYRPRG